MLDQTSWEVDPLLCPYDIPAPQRDAHRVTHQRRADHRAHLASCWLRGRRPVGE